MRATVRPIRRRLLDHAAMPATESPTLQLLRERLLSRALSTDCEREGARPRGAQDQSKSGVVKL